MKKYSVYIFLALFAGILASVVDGRYPISEDEPVIIQYDQPGNLDSLDGRYVIIEGACIIDEYVVETENSDETMHYAGVGCDSFAESSWLFAVVGTDYGSPFHGPESQLEAGEISMFQGRLLSGSGHSYRAKDLFDEMGVVYADRDQRYHILTGVTPASSRKRILYAWVLIVVIATVVYRLMYQYHRNKANRPPKMDYEQLRQRLHENQLIPLDKSWMIRMGILDMRAKSRDTTNFLQKQENLGDDLKALLQASMDWYSNRSKIVVGESGTLFRFLQFTAWKAQREVTFVKSGTLPQREMANDPDLVNWPQHELLKLDHGTTQWASAAALNGDQERLPNAPHKLQVTYEAIDHWNKQQEKQTSWEPRYDETIEQQAMAWVGLALGHRPNWKPLQAEDYCFARMFDYITKEEGLARWPNLQGHESNRIEAMETVIEQVQSGKQIVSDDHRVVQAAALWLTMKGKPVNCSNPQAVNKTWSQFWKYLETARGLV